MVKCVCYQWQGSQRRYPVLSGANYSPGPGDNYMVSFIHPLNQHVMKHMVTVLRTTQSVTAFA